MAAIPLVAVETATGTTGSDGLAVFTFSANIDTSNHLLAVDRLPQGDGIDYTVTAARQVTFVAPNIPLAGAKIWLWNGVVGTSVSTGLPAWDTVAEIVSDAAIELGLVSAAIADPFASTDPNILQLVALLKSGGRRLARSRQWTHLQSEYTFATVSGTATYALPSDFRAMINQTAWNRGSGWPLLGPTSPQRWQFIQAISGTIVWAEFRPQGGQLKITPTPTSAQTIAFEYMTTSWVRPSGQTVPTADFPTLATDTVCFDPFLAVRMLKLAFANAKGLDDDSYQEDYEEALMMVTSDDAASPVISLNDAADTPLINWRNVPDTGYG